MDALLLSFSTEQKIRGTIFSKRLDGGSKRCLIACLKRETALEERLKRRDVSARLGTAEARGAHLSKQTNAFQPWDEPTRDPPRCYLYSSNLSFLTELLASRHFVPVYVINMFLSFLFRQRNDYLATLFNL